VVEKIVRNFGVVLFGKIALNKKMSRVNRNV